MADVFGLLSPNDLAGFSQRVEQSDPFGLISRSLQSWQPDTSRMGAMGSGISSFARSFLSGLATNYAQNRAAEQLSSVINVLPQLTSDPYSVATPEGVDSGAFGLLKGSAILNRAIRGEQREDTLADLMQKVKIAGMTKEAEKLGEYDAYKKMGAGASDVPGTPQYDAAKDTLAKTDALRKELTSNPEIATFTDVRDRMNVLLKAVKDPSVVADLDYVYGIAKILDPGSVVRESEGQNIISSNSIPGTTLGMLNKALSGESAVNRASLFDLAKRHYDTRSERVGAILDNYSRLAEERKAKPEDVLPFSRESLALPMGAASSPRITPEQAQAELARRRLQAAAAGGIIP